MKKIHDPAEVFKPFRIVCNCCNITWEVEANDLRYEASAQRDRDHSGSVYVYCPKAKGVIQISPKTENYAQILIIARDNSTKWDR